MIEDNKTFGDSIINTAILKLQGENAILLSQNKALVEALEWYASAENHKKQWTKASDQEWYSSVETDEGNKARLALTTYKGEIEK